MTEEKKRSGQLAGMFFLLLFSEYFINFLKEYFSRRISLLQHLLAELIESDHTTQRHYYLYYYYILLLLLSLILLDSYNVSVRVRVPDPIQGLGL